MTPYVFSMLFGIIVTELQGGVAYTMMEAHPDRTVTSVKMIRFHAFDITGGVHKAIGRVCGDGHNTAEIIYKKAIGAPLVRFVPNLESMKSWIWLGLYRWESTQQTTSPT